MSEAAQQLNIPFYPFVSSESGGQKPMPENEQEDPIIDPREEKLPPEESPSVPRKEPPLKMPAQREPPMTEDDLIDPSKNPVIVGDQALGGFEDGYQFI